MNRKEKAVAHNRILTTKCRNTEGIYHSIKHYDICFKQKPFKDAGNGWQKYKEKWKFTQSPTFSPQEFLIQTEKEQLCSKETWQTPPYQVLKANTTGHGRWQCGMHTARCAEDSSASRFLPRMYHLDLWGNTRQAQTEEHSIKTNASASSKVLWSSRRNHFQLKDLQWDGKEMDPGPERGKNISCFVSAFQQSIAWI